MEEMHRARYGERAQNFCAFSRPALVPHLHVFTNPETLQIQSFWLSMAFSAATVSPPENKQIRSGQGTEK